MINNSQLRVGIYGYLSGYSGVSSCVNSLIKGLNELGIVPTLLTDQDVSPEFIFGNRIELKIVLVRKSLPRPLWLGLSKIGFSSGLEMFYYSKLSWLEEFYDFIYILEPGVIVDIDVNHLYYLHNSPRAIGYSNRRFLPVMKWVFYKFLWRFIVPAYEFSNPRIQCVINSQFTANLFREAFGRKIPVIYPPISVYSTDHDDVNKSKICGTVIIFGRISRPKRLELVFDLANSCSALKFCIIGKESDAEYAYELERIAAEKNLTNVEFIKNPKNSVLEAKLRTSEYYMFFARKEHFGICTVEAMSFGMIPFVHNSGGQAEIVPWSVCKFDDDSMVDDFMRLLTLSAAEKEALRRKAMARAQEFSEKNYINRMVSYLQ